MLDHTFAPRRRWQLRISHDRLIVAATILRMTVDLLCGEKISVGAGLDWDGQLYGRLARDFWGEIAENPLSAYHVQRILPSALVYASWLDDPMPTAGVERSPGNWQYLARGR